jgi:hypothetical protein
MSFSGNESTMSVSLADTASMVDVGTKLFWGRPIVWASLGAAAVATYDAKVDMGSLPADTFVVGSDVPPDVDCTRTPANAECHA